MGAVCGNKTVDVTASEKVDKSKSGPVGNTTPRKGGNDLKARFLESVKNTV